MAEQESNNLAVISVVCGIVGLLILAVPFGTAALVTGCMAKSNKGLAILGVILGVVDICFGIIAISVLGL